MSDLVETFRVNSCRFATEAELEAAARVKRIAGLIEENTALRKQLERARSDVWAHGFNRCMHTAISALNYLSSHARPNGGQDAYNSEHLLQIADEIKRTIAHNIALTDEEGK